MGRIVLGTHSGGDAGDASVSSIVGFEVKGTLDVNGTHGSEVVLTSDAPSPAAGDWNGIRLQSSAVANLDEAIVEYVTLGVYVSGSAQLTSASGLEIA